MTYVLLDDNFGDHPKVEELSDRAFRAHVRALCWVKRHKTGGVIPKGAVGTICRGRRTVPPELVRARLWESHPLGWKIHDWEAWGNEDVELAAAVRSEADEKRLQLSEKRRLAGRAGGLRSVESRREAFGTAHPKQLEANVEATGGSKPEATEANPPSKTEASSPRAIARSGTRARPSESESASESSEDPTGNVAAEDLTGSAPPAAPAGGDGALLGERETVCPLDLEAKAVELGVVRQLAEGLRTSEGIRPPLL